MIDMHYIIPERLTGGRALSTLSTNMPKWVLVVDDDPTIVSLLTDLLESVGCSVTSAADAMQASIQARTLKPILVITDMMMPSFGTGADVLKRLRADPYLKSVPVVVLTGMHPEKARQALPPDDPLLRLLFKPVNWQTLQAVIGPVLRAHGVAATGPQAPPGAGPARPGGPKAP